MSTTAAHPSLDESTRDGRDARWRAHRIARRHELVEAALRAIRTNGAGVGMEEIATEARTSKTVLYRHLGDRLGLYLAVCESVDARILNEIEQATRESGGFDATAAMRLPQLLNAVIDSYLRLVERDPEVYRFVVRRPDVTLPDGPGGEDPVTGLSGRIADNVALLIERLCPEDQAERGRSRVEAWALVGLVKESADRWLENPGGLTRADLAHHLAEFAYRGLAQHTPTTQSDETALRTSTAVRPSPRAPQRGH